MQVSMGSGVPLYPQTRPPDGWQSLFVRGNEATRPADEQMFPGRLPELSQMAPQKRQPIYASRQAPNRADFASARDPARCPQCRNV